MTAAAPTTMPTPLSTFSFAALLALVTVVGLSSAMFWALVRRATSHRQWVTFAEWGKRKGFRIRRHDPAEDAPPPPFDRLGGAPPVVRYLLISRKRRTFLLQCERPAAPALRQASVVHAARAADEPDVWNLLVRRVEARWPPTALRPAEQAGSVADLFSLASFPTMLSPDRFLVFGTDSAPARALARSLVTALLPPDVGLLLHGHSLVLDFSTRPFDPIEFDRMLALADQLAGYLPEIIPPPVRR